MKALSWRDLSKRRMTPVQRANLKRQFAHWQKVGLAVVSFRQGTEGKIHVQVQVSI